MVLKYEVTFIMGCTGQKTRGARAHISPMKEIGLLSLEKHNTHVRRIDPQGDANPSFKASRVWPE